MSDSEATILEEFKEKKGRRKSYSDYKRTGIDWLENIPQHWEINRAEKWFSSNAEKVQPEEMECHKVKHYSLPNIHEEGDGQLEDPDEISSQKKILTGKEVLISKLNPENGMVVLPEFNNHTAIASTEFVDMSTYDDVLRKFGYYFYSSQNVRQYLSSEAQSVTLSHKRVKPRVIQRIPFPEPPGEEQEAIVDFLDREINNIDSLIKEKRKLIDLIEEKRNTVIKNTVIKGLDSEVTLKESGVDWLGKVPEHWDVPRIRFVARMESGHTPNKSESEYWDGDIPWVSLADSGWMREHDYITETAKTISEAGIANSSARILPPETMVFTRDATVGLCAITTREMAVSQHIIGWICEDNLLPEYLLSVTKAMDQELNRLTMGATISTVGMEDIKKLKMPLPPKEEQEEIVEYLNEKLRRFEDSIEKIQESSEYLKEYRTALITETVTGQIDVRGEM